MRERIEAPLIRNNARHPVGGRGRAFGMALGICALLSMGVVAPAAGVENDNTPRPRPERIKSGTGFFITAENILLTSAHIVINCKNVSIFPVDGTQRLGLIIALDKELDLALMSVSGPFLGQPLLDAVTRPRVGEQIYALGYGVSPTDPNRPVYLTGILKEENTLPNGVRVLVMHARIPAGTSGAPLVDPQAGLIGVVIGRYTVEPELGVAIPVQAIRNFARKNGFMLSAEGAREQAPAERDRLLLNASALVQCNTK